MKWIGAFAVGAAAIAGGLAYVSAWPGSQLFGRTLIAGTDANEVALTFDDGPNDAATPALLDVLANHNVRATFFMMGSYVRQQLELARRVSAAGHLIGNHTMEHPKLSLAPQHRIRQELADCRAVLEDATGLPVRFFRPPFGARRPAVLRTARELGMTPVMWNVTCHDWNPIGPDGIFAHMRSGLARNCARHRGSNILLHDGGHLAMGTNRMDTVRAVDRLLTEDAEPQRRWLTVDAWQPVA